MPSPPGWLKSLANSVAVQMTPVEQLSPIGCHYCQVDGIWEVTIFASKTHIVGGKMDGLMRPSKFHVDLRGVMNLLTEVREVHWQPLPMGPEDELGSHLSIEGTYDGQPVWLRILARAPKRFKPGRRAIVYELQWEEVW